MPKVKLSVPGQPPEVLECQLQGNTFSIQRLIQGAIQGEGQTQTGTVVLSGSGEGWLNLNGNILPFFMTQQTDGPVERLSIWLQGQVYTLERHNAHARATGAKSSLVADGDIKAPMPGTVLKILAQPGDNVAANQPLIIMESMKMEMTLTLPAAGMVKTVRCEAGQLVDMGALLMQVTLTPPEEPA
ncbi:acetyl-CoA carboxylase biotin carboxyl carrier protein subunit [Vampirovibrio chlorellavorus]|uniref:acetyl-CoA carboxylase biotin carboxyl carrier protein subunit n=1 Tax=Vampirovibrio chlorellavorus TaxID=758823 RepID=UPI0026F34B22|nr:acetyl-CoA carboxylase biotin carboxyl carrier protein subunit [Vampirovibrio chlorellavorus]